MVAERSSPQRIQSVVVKPKTRKIIHHPIRSHPIAQRIRAARLLQIAKNQTRGFNKAQLKAAKSESINAQRPTKTPAQRLDELTDDVLEIETDDLRDLLKSNQASRGQLLKRSTFKPRASTNVHSVSKPDDILENSSSNIRQIVRTVVKRAPLVGSTQTIHTQTYIKTHSKGFQKGSSSFTVEQRSVETQAGKSYIKLLKKHWLNTSAHIEPVAPIHLDHTFDFGTHAVPIARPPRPAATQVSGAYAQQQQQQRCAQPFRHQPRFAPPVFQQPIQQPYPQPLQQPIHYQPYQFPPVQFDPFAPIQYVPVQPSIAGPTTAQLERKRNRAKSATYRKKYPRQE